MNCLKPGFGCISFCISGARYPRFDPTAYINEKNRQKKEAQAKQ